MEKKPNLAGWSERLIDRLAYSRDASLYRLVPRAVVRPANEQEVQELLRYAHKNHIPVTFRTGGTSLSGQSVTEGIIAEVVRNWDRIEILDQGKAIKLQPGVIGARANQSLRSYRRKIGPDPASINSAMIGGIISNNASGMVCGVQNNAYHTLKHIRFILPNGHIYDTSISTDYSRFVSGERVLCEGLIKAQKQIESKAELKNKIRRKYKIKNTLGYSLNAFLDFEHPLDIFSHLLVGGEGTLAFLSSLALNTLPDPVNKSTGLVFFRNPKIATESIPVLIEHQAAAVELMDSASLMTAKYVQNAPYGLDLVQDDTTALLIELQNDDIQDLSRQEQEIIRTLQSMEGEFVAGMTREDPLRTVLWNIRKGLYPTVGSLRKSGTSIITEDICYQFTDLPEVVTELKSIFKKWSYNDSVIFGHAKDGNLHFVTSIDLNQSEGVKAFDGLMKDLVSMTVDRFNGSLKAEHGTGRNMAPFVESEWGGELYEIMWHIKTLADPEDILNPGVLLNRDDKTHLKNLKQIPQVNEKIDLCVECGFCERVCPSRELTLTPRQRIIIARELKLNHAFKFKVANDNRFSSFDTCAVDALCETACPVNINTGSFVKAMRAEQHSGFAEQVSLWTVNNFALTQLILRKILDISHGISRITGFSFLERFTRLINKSLSGKIPCWDRVLPKTAPPVHFQPTEHSNQWIYYTACINRIFSGTSGKESLADMLLEIGQICGFQLIFPAGLETTCCGTPYNSKGYEKADKKMVLRTINILYESSQEGTIPVLVDTSPCSYKLLQVGKELEGEALKKWESLTIVDIVPFLNNCLKQVAVREKLNREIILHPTCSTVKMGMKRLLVEIGYQCAEKVILPENWNCCAFAGDRGLLFPELTRSATQREADEVKSVVNNSFGYSTSRTCEIGMEKATGLRYTSIAVLVRDYLRQNIL